IDENVEATEVIDGGLHGCLRAGQVSYIGGVEESSLAQFGSDALAVVLVELGDHHARACSAYARQIAAPIPLPPPVATAALPSRLKRATGGNGTRVPLTPALSQRWGGFAPLTPALSQRWGGFAPLTPALSQREREFVLCGAMASQAHQVDFGYNPPTGLRGWE